jgi:leucine dehydrogenase
LIKGVGNVGYCLAKLLHKQNVKLFITDLDIQKAKRYENELKATFVDPDAIFNNNYNIVCPCDTEFTVTEKNILSIKTDILLGATNNQLEHDYLADELANKGILYCPDYVVNSGGLIYVAALYEKKSTQDILDKIKKLYATTENILKYADTHQLSTKASADKMAEEIITSSYEEKITA